MSQILAGDIGGTRARFALLEATGRRVAHQEVLESRTFGTFEAALTRFLDGARAKRKVGHKGEKILAASFGIAGPVVNQCVKTTNLPWVIDAATIGRELGVADVTLLNDLVAVGLGALAATPAKLQVLQVGRPNKKGGNVAVIAAGTGLGEAAFVWDGTTHVACPTEGSHVDFAPRTPVEVELWSVLTREYGHVSYERVASGSTISAIYTFFVRDQRIPESKANASLVARAPDQNVAVVDLAESGKSEAAMRAIELWSSVYGAEAGNLALKCLATSGVYVCGGASARLAKVLAQGLPARRKRARGAGAAASPFLDAFVDKGRMRPILEKIPIAVCTEPLAGLLGAAAHAAGRAAGAGARSRSKGRAKR
jgi:glucokinase